MKNLIIILLFIISSLIGCREKYTPKPRGYFRIGFPAKSYSFFNESGFPFQFEIPDYSQIQKINGNHTQPYDINITIPQNKADIHISYKEIDVSDYPKIPSKNTDIKEIKKMILSNLCEDSRTLAYKHTIKADAIEERLFINPSKNVYGTIYIIKGNAASPLQFYLTDSVNHFLRGSLYIRNIPNADSIKPVIDFLKPDLIRLIETTSWK